MFERWQRDGVLVRDDAARAVGARAGLHRPRRAPPHAPRASSRACASRTTGPGRIRPHERTHPGPKEDRLRLTRATQANLSPIFSLYDDPAGAAWGALAPHLAGAPWGEVTDEDGTVHRLWRVADPAAIAAVARRARAGAELLIADGHHRYETARVYDEEGGAGHVLMCLVALQDPGLTVFPTHRLITGLDGPRREALRATIERDFEVAAVDADELEPARATDRCGWATSTPTTAAR